MLVLTLVPNLHLIDEKNLLRLSFKSYLRYGTGLVEMIRAAGDMDASMIHDLAAAIIPDGKVPSDWEQSFIVCLYKGKGDALERGN